MHHSAFTDSFIELSADDKQFLLQEARSSLKAAAENSSYKTSNLQNYSTALQQAAASFVTLTKEGQLRGCIGSLEARQPLINDVIDNARSSALRDPRFPPVKPYEVDDIKIEISVLSPLVQMQFNDEDDLLQQIKPFKDGLVLEDGMFRGTFLPLVWEKIPDKAEFLCQLKLKAGLPLDYWSDTLRVSRYHTIIFEE